MEQFNHSRQDLQNIQCANLRNTSRYLSLTCASVWNPLLVSFFNPVLSWSHMNLSSSFYSEASAMKNKVRWLKSLMKCCSWCLSALLFIDVATCQRNVILVSAPTCSLMELCDTTSRFITYVHLYFRNYFISFMFFKTYSNSKFPQPILTVVHMKPGEVANI